MIISKTPLRISFAGGGTDLPSFYRNNEYGAVLSTSINSYLYVTIKKQPPYFNERYRLNYSKTELVNNIEKIENSIIRECLRFMEVDDRLYISTIADAPESTGLGSSSSFCVGLLNALYYLKGKNISKERLAEEAAHIEVEVLKRPMGKQDHYAAAIGGVNYIKFQKDESVFFETVNIDGEKTKKLIDSILLFWTNKTRPSESILKEQDENNTQNTDLLILMRKQAEEVKELLYQKKYYAKQFGKIINDGWIMKKKLASKVSNANIDNYYNIAMKSGAYGGKISGAGGGGFLLLVAEPSKHKNIVNNLISAGLKRASFGIDFNGASVTEIE